jgi:hypothetical protein
MDWNIFFPIFYLNSPSSKLSGGKSRTLNSSDISKPLIFSVIIFLNSLKLGQKNLGNFNCWLIGFFCVCVCKAFDIVCHRGDMTLRLLSFKLIVFLKITLSLEEENGDKNLLSRVLPLLYRLCFYPTDTCLEHT